MSDKADHEAGSSTVTAVHGGSPSELEQEFITATKAADVLIARSRLGIYGAQFLAPFTRQFRTAIRTNFPEDVVTFDETDRNERIAVADARQMRIITFVLFLVFSAGALTAATNGLSYLEPKSGGYLIALAVFAGATVLALSLRFLVRRDYLNDIAGTATTFANYFFKEISSIHDCSINAVRASTEDMMMTPGWPDRSGGWIKIALWYGKRYENLDRYVTAAAWKVESRYRWIERIANMLKATVIVGVITASFLLLAHDAKIERISLTAVVLVLYVFISYSYWGLKPQKNNAYWAEKFRSSIVGFDAQKEHINNQIAKVVAADKRLFMGSQRNVGKERAG